MNHFEKYDRDTRKELSQNYIKNPSLVRRLLEFTNFEQGDIIVDIGSGQGAFTDELLALGHTVHAVEKDPKNAQDVFAKHKKNKNFSIFSSRLFSFSHLYPGLLYIIIFILFSISRHLCHL